MHWPGPRILALFFVLVPLFLHAQAPATRSPAVFTLQGSVQTLDGKPLAGARVDIRSGTSSDDAIADTRSDSDGKFALIGVPLTPGPYLLHASSVGFNEVDQQFRIAASPVSTSLSFTFTLKPSTVERGAKVGYTVVRVYYATDRKQQVEQNTISYLGERASGSTLSYGSCDVSIPATHELAAVERPAFWRFEFYPDPEKHIVLQKVAAEPKNQFFRDISGLVASSPAKEAFVFIHGYNVSFEDAALRTAQLAYDFNFKGAPIFYSWPSRGRLFGYLDDEDTIQQSVAPLRQFLQEVADQTGASVVHVIAHSMGNRAMLPALSQLAADPHFKSFGKFNTIVFAAPDVDRDVFISLVGTIHNPSNKITLYVSEHDQALAASHLLFHKEPRAGEGGSNAIVLAGIDTVDVSRLSMDALGHSYFGDNRIVIEDLLKFFKGQLAPRPGLSKIAIGNLALWQMLPSAAN